MVEHSTTEVVMLSCRYLYSTIVYIILVLHIAIAEWLVESRQIHIIFLDKKFKDYSDL